MGERFLPPTPMCLRVSTQKGAFSLFTRVVLWFMLLSQPAFSPLSSPPVSRTLAVPCGVAIFSLIKNLVLSVCAGSFFFAGTILHFFRSSCLRSHLVVPRDISCFFPDVLCPLLVPCFLSLAIFFPPLYHILPPITVCPGFRLASTLYPSEF